MDKNILANKKKISSSGTWEHVQPLTGPLIFSELYHNYLNI